MDQTVMYRWRHLKIGRSRPRKTTKKPGVVSKTLRSRLGTLSHYMKDFSIVVKTGFPVKRLNMTSFNAAVKQNYHTAIVGEFPNFKIDHSLVQISKGTLDHVHRPALLLKDTGAAVIEWVIPTRLKLGLEENDSIHLFFYRDVLRKRVCNYEGNVAIRRDGYVDITPFLDKFGTMHVWIFLVSADGKRPSDSRYLGEIGLQ